VEILFNIFALLAVLQLRRSNRLRGQHFHIYLIAYGSFRFFHEFVRDEPRIFYRFSGYQFAALAVFSLGLERFINRAIRQDGERKLTGRISPA
jgi:phosphatidylglycerol:prolipoprotein diacylglycerol transferase